MATKKHVLVKVVKAKGKPVAKKSSAIVKAVPNKPVKAPPAKKAPPKNALAKAVTKKVATSVGKKAVVQPSVKKSVIKPVIKKSVKPAIKPVKSVAQIVRKKVLVKTEIKPLIKKEVPKPATVKNNIVKAANPAQKIMSKKEEIKSPAAKPATEKTPMPKPVAEAKVKDIKVPAPKAVVMPKIITKTVRKYQPEFTKSVLDKAQRDPGAPSQRYSDAELQEFRELIQRKLEAAKKELSYLHGLITRKDELGGDEGDNRYMTMEDGSLSMEREQLSQMASRQITFIDHLEKAVMRIENKTYGICRVTGKLIDKARLRAVPHATLSIEAKMGAGR